MIAGRARGRGALQARPHGLRAVEAVEARRARLAVARGHHDARPAGLAYRVLGDVVEHLGETFDIHGGGIDLVFPAPRERDRAVALRVPQSAVGAHWDAQRLPAGRRREDVEEPRQLLHHSATCWPIGQARCCASTCCDALSPADRLDGKGSGRARKSGPLASDSGDGRRPGHVKARRGAAEFNLRRLEHAQDDRELHALDGRNLRDLASDPRRSSSSAAWKALGSGSLAQRLTISSHRRRNDPSQSAPRRVAKKGVEQDNNGQPHKEGRDDEDKPYP